MPTLPTELAETDDILAREDAPPTTDEVEAAVQRLVEGVLKKRDATACVVRSR